MLEGIDKLLHAIFGEPDDLPFKFLPRWTRHRDGRYLHDALNKVLATLPLPRDRTILELRFGLLDEQPKDLSEVGRAVGVTPERVRHKEAKSLRALRHPSRTKLLKPFSPGAIAWRLAFARRDLYCQLSKLYPQRVAETVVLRVKLEDMQQAFKSTEAALKSSCGVHISACLYCGTPLPPHWNFCNIHCRAKWRVIPLVCDGCGQQFHRNMSQMFAVRHGQKAASGRVFCNRPCYIANMKRLGVTRGPRVKRENTLV